MKNKILSLLLVFAFLIPCMFALSGCKNEEEPPAEATKEVWDGKIAKVSNAVNGVVTIETAEELAGFAKSVNDGNTYDGITVKITCDMDLQNKDWTPIGYGYAYGPMAGVVSIIGKDFAGTFDACGYTISNVKVVATKGGESGAEGASAGVGFFGLVTGEVKNLKLENIKVTGNHWVGGVVGYLCGYRAEDIGKITNCHVKNADINCEYKNTKDSGDKAGAIVGIITAGSVTNCSAKASTVKAARDAGQLIGCVIYEDLKPGIDFATGNSQENVVVSDNNGTQNTSNNDNIKNELVGRND